MLAALEADIEEMDRKCPRATVAKDFTGQDTGPACCVIS
jgi:hypothetical protein